MSPTLGSKAPKKKKKKKGKRKIPKYPTEGNRLESMWEFEVFYEKLQEARMYPDELP